MKKSAIDRFCAKVKINHETGCWDWTGSFTRGGYGSFSYKGKTTRVHRFSYTHFIGEIPEVLDIDHLCRNRACVNPLHMETVTRKVNCRRGECGKLTGLQNRQKSHCPQGHPYNKENTTWDKKGERTCKICRKVSKLRYRRGLGVKSRVRSVRFLSIYAPELLKEVNR